MSQPRSTLVLVIEDDDVVRGTIAAYLEDSGFSIVEAEDGQVGLNLVREKKPDLVLVDLQMPLVHGLKVLAAVKQETPDLPIIVVSGATSVPDVVQALRLGAWDFVTKPITDLAILEHAVDKALERAGLLREKERHREHLEEVVAERTKALESELGQRRVAEERVKESLQRLESVLEATVHALAAAVEIKDPHTSGHQQRVMRLAVAIAELIGLPQRLVAGIRVAGLLHDIGKISVPAEILSKPGKLGEVEKMLLRQHPQVGSDLLKDIPFEWPVAEIVLQHHERLDGSGYPQGLRREAILAEARIIAVADVVEALSSHRPYRPAFGIETALDEVARLSGVAYDEEIVRACLALFQERGFSLD